jgi:hypothetical protein
MGKWSGNSLASIRKLHEDAAVACALAKAQADYDKDSKVFFAGIFNEYTFESAQWNAYNDVRVKLLREGKV